MLLRSPGHATFLGAAQSHPAVAVLKRRMQQNRHKSGRPSLLSPMVDDKFTPLSDCVRFEGRPYGLGSNLLSVWWATTFLKHVQPSTTFYYTNIGSYYQCWANSSAAAFFVPGGGALRVDAPPANCSSVRRHIPVEVTRYYLRVKNAAASAGPDADLGRAGIGSSRVQSPIMLETAVRARCSIVEDFWKLTPELQIQVDKAREDLAADHPIIAMHARGGDKTVRELWGVVLESGHYPMAPGMRVLAGRHPHLVQNATCVVVGDDAALSQMMADWANRIFNCGRLVMRGPQQGGHTQNSFNSMSLEDRCKATQRLLVDLEVMAFAHFFIGNQKSNLDALVQAIRRCKYYHAEDSMIAGTGAREFGIWV